MSKPDEMSEEIKARFKHMKPWNIGLIGVGVHHAAEVAKLKVRIAELEGALEHRRSEMRNVWTDAYNKGRQDQMDGVPAYERQALEAPDD